MEDKMDGSKAAESDAKQKKAPNATKSTTLFFENLPLELHSTAAVETMRVRPDKDTVAEIRARLHLQCTETIGRCDDGPR